VKGVDPVFVISLGPVQVVLDRLLIPGQLPVFGYLLPEVVQQWVTEIYPFCPVLPALMLPDSLFQMRSGCHPDRGYVAAWRFLPVTDCCWQDG